MSEISTIQWIEVTSAILAVIGVWLNSKPHILGWPIGIVSVVLAAFVYFEFRLFAEFGLQIFYTISGFYGWWKWWTEKEKIQELLINKIKILELVVSILFGFFLTIFIGYWLRNNTNADFPWVDSGLAAFSLVAQIWLARKYIENWLLWMAINMISVVLYAVKGLWFFTGLYLILFFLAVLGYRNWSQKSSSRI